MTNPEHLRICVNCDKGWIEHVRNEACGEFLPVCGEEACRRPRGHDGPHDCEHGYRVAGGTATCPPCDAGPSDQSDRESGR